MNLTDTANGIKRIMMKFRRCMEQYNKILTSLYYVVFCILFGVNYIRLTMVWNAVPNQGIINQIYSVAVWVALAIAIIQMARMNWRELLLALLLLITGIIYKELRTENAYIWALLIIGAYRCEFDRIVQIALVIAIGFTGIGMIGSQQGVVIDLLRYKWGEDAISRSVIRHSWGAIHTTDLGKQIVTAFMMLIYATRHRKQHWVNPCIVLVGVILYFYPGVKTAVAGLALLAIGFTAYKLYAIPVRRWQAGGVELLYVGFFVGLYLISANAELYKEKLIKFGVTFYYRFAYAAQAISEYRIHLFGSDIKQNGFGGQIIAGDYGVNIEYFYIDSGFMRVLLMFGIWGCMVFMICLSVILHKAVKANEILILLIFVIYAINGISEECFMTMRHNVFMLGVFATIGTGQFEHSQKNLRNVDGNFNVEEDGKSV